MHHTREIFGLPVGASPEELTAAYRKLVKQNHPDLVGSSLEATERMKNINAAYDALKKGELPEGFKVEPVRPARPGRGFAEATSGAGKVHEDSRGFTRSDFAREQPKGGNGFSRFSFRQRAQEAEQPRSDSGFGFGWKAKQESQASQDKEARDRAAQQKAWFADQEKMRERVVTGSEDFSKAAQGVQGETEAERRAAMMRNLREMRQARMEEPKPTYSPRQEAPQPDPVRTEQARSAYTRAQNGFEQTETDAPIPLKVRSMFGIRKVNEMIIDDKTDKAMDAKWSEVSSNEARKVVQARRDGVAHDEVKAFHKAQKVTMEGDIMNVYLGSRGVAGKNVVMAPMFVRDQDGLRQEEGKVAAFAMGLKQDGKQAHAGAENLMVQQANGVKVRIHFADQRENLRVQSRARVDRTA